MKKSSLAEGLRVAAGQKAAPAIIPEADISSRKNTGKSVLIGGHFRPEVRRTLMLVQAEPNNEGKNLKQLLGEAINDLCAKYGKPQPYQGDI